MHCLAACEEAEHIIKKAKYFPSSVPAPSYHHQTRIGRETNIRELYEAECARDLKRSGQPHLRSGSMLLEKLVARDRLHTLIINLHAGNKGYSISVRTFVPTNDNCIDNNPSTSGLQGKMLKEVPMDGEFSYKMDRLLRYIDNEELPYFLALLLETNYSYMFYSGCLIAEIRDYRQVYPRFMCDTHYVLLKPSTQTFQADITYLATKYELNEQDRRQLENKLLVNTIPLCLDPSPANALVANKIQHERQLLNTLDLHKAAHSYSQVAMNRKRKLTHIPRRGFELLDTINRHRAKTRTSTTSSTTSSINSYQLPSVPHHHPPSEPVVHFPPIPASSLNFPPMSHPSGENLVTAHARRIEDIPLTSNVEPRVIDTFEKKINDRDPEQKRVNHIKLTLFQRMSNLEYIGELYLDSDYQEGQSKGSACRFSLGPSKKYAYSYKSQFLEIFNETAPDVQQQSTTATVASNSASNSNSIVDENYAVCHAQQNAQQSGVQAAVVAATAQATPRSVIKHLANGSSGGLAVLLHGSQGVISASASQINSSNLPILQSQLQSNLNQTSRSQIRQAPFTIARSSSTTDTQQYQLTSGQPTGVSKVTNAANNATILSRLNSTPANHQNSAESAAVANAIINNSNIAIVGLTTPHRTLAALSHQKSKQNQQRQVTAAASRATQILNNAGTINNLQQQSVQINLSQLAATSQAQTFNITQLNATNLGFAAVPLNSVNNTQQKPMTNHNATTTRLIAPSATSPGTKRSSPGTVNSADSRLHALLKGTAAADHHVEGANSESSILERIRASSGTSPVPSASPTSSKAPTSVMHLVTQSPKTNNNNPGSSPLSSPPPQVVGQQSLNLAQLANLATAGQQTSEYVQLQIPGIPQPIQFPINMSSAGVSHAGVLLPISTTSATSNAHIMSNATASNATVVPFTILAQSVNKSNVRGGTTSQHLQVVGALQRPRLGAGSAAATRALLQQRTPNNPIRIATPNTTVTNIQTMNAANVGGANNSILTLSSAQPTQQLQVAALHKQAHLQQFQHIQQLQQRINQQQQKSASATSAVAAAGSGMTPAAVATKFRRRSNAADPNK